MDPDFLENEEKYKTIKKGKLGLCESLNSLNKDFFFSHSL